MNEKTVKENLSSMTFKEKLDYLLYYYKVHVIVFILIIAAIGSFIYTEATKKSIYLDISYLGGYISEETSQNIQSSIEDILIPGDEKNIVQINSFGLENGGDITKVQASIAAHEIDIAIMNKANFEKYYQADIFLDLNSISDFSSLNISDDSLVKRDNGVYGIKVSNLDIFNKLDAGDNILVVISNTENIDKIMPLLKSCKIK